MTDRYTLQPMGDLWNNPASKFLKWLKVELANLKARVALNRLSAEAYMAIKRNAKVDVTRIDVLEAEFDHDMIAFIVQVQESLVAAGVGQYKEEFHKELTSYDIEDPAFILRLREAVKMLLVEFRKLQQALWLKAQDHQWTLMIASTHGQDAEPSTYGALLMVYYQAVSRSVVRLKRLLREELSEGKMSGAVGTYGAMDLQLEEKALANLGLKAAKAETQILQRDRIAAVMDTFAEAAGTIEQIARTFWELMRSRTRELEEPRRKKQRGSSAMAHKKNPILTERLMGMARVMRAYAGAALEDIATPECRDISQSSVERIIVPDACILLHYMASKAAGLVQNVTVFTERMRYNLDVASLGVWAGQQVRNALMKSGIDYDTAYSYVQVASFEAVKTNVHVSQFFTTQSISEDDKRTAESILGADQLASCFDAMAYIRDGINHIFQTKEE